VMGEAKNAALELAEDVQVWCFGGQCHRSCGKSRLAIESGSSYARAGQKVSNGFQSLPGLVSWV
jgi:hypothetical protein